MTIELPKTNIHVAVVLLILTKFNISFEIEVNEGLIRISVSDNLPMMLFWDLGEATGMLGVEIERIMENLNFPIGQKKY